MVQFCPKCGTQAPDDESVFCNKCGAKLPPVIPVKKDILCPRCGTKATDEHSVFCDRCGSPLPKAPQAQVRQTRMQPAAPPPAMIRKRCISCGAPLAYEDTDYCDACLVHMHKPELPESPVTAHRRIPEPDPVPAPRKIPEPDPVPAYRKIPEQDTIPPAAPVAVASAPVPDGIPGADEPPAGKRNWKSIIAVSAIALVVIVVLAVVAGFVTGMIPGLGKDNATAPATPAEEPASVTTIPTTKVTTSPTPKTTAIPGMTTITTTRTTKETVNVSAAPAINTTVTAGTNTTANATANVTPSVTKPLSNIDASRSFSIGETATDGKGKLTLHGYSLKDKLKDPTPSNAIGKKYLILNITYENLQQNATTEVDLKGMTVEDAGSFAFDQVTDDPMLENPFYFSGKTVPPLENRTGNMAFIISPDATFLKFRYNFGDGKIATFQLPQYL